MSKDAIYDAPETQVKYLQGDVYGHSRFSNGKNICTSSLVLLDIENKRAKTQNTEYILGQIDPEYQKFLNQQKEDSSIS
jgi:hypothetical protein